MSGGSLAMSTDWAWLMSLIIDAKSCVLPVEDMSPARKVDMSALPFPPTPPPAPPLPGVSWHRPLTQLKPMGHGVGSDDEQAKPPLLTFGLKQPLVDESPNTHAAKMHQRTT
jgi:hypothetical protein